jgi:hypothetical protein
MKKLIKNGKPIELKLINSRPALPHKFTKFDFNFFKKKYKKITKFIFVKMRKFHRENKLK